MPQKCHKPSKSVTVARVTRMSQTLLPTLICLYVVYPFCPYEIGGLLTLGTKAEKGFALIVQQRATLFDHDIAGH